MHKRNVSAHTIAMPTGQTVVLSREYNRERSFFCHDESEEEPQHPLHRWTVPPQYVQRELLHPRCRQYRHSWEQPHHEGMRWLQFLREAFWLLRVNRAPTARLCDWCMDYTDSQSLYISHKGHGRIMALFTKKWKSAWTQVRFVV